VIQQPPKMHTAFEIVGKLFLFPRGLRKWS